jgi:hypothetical protein
MKIGIRGVIPRKYLDSYNAVVVTEHLHGGNLAAAVHMDPPLLLANIFSTKQ